MGAHALRYVPPPDSNRDSDSDSDGGESLIRLLVKHQRRLHAYILALVPNWADSEDILQETSVRLFEQHKEWDATRDFMPWACTIAHYQVLTYRKRKQREKLRFSPQFLDSISAEIEKQSDELDVRHDYLKSCVEKLSPSARNLIKIAYLDGLKISQVAERLDRTVTSTYKALLRIRKSLHICIEHALSEGKVE